MKIATAAYPLDVLTSWAQYEDKLSAWVDEAASHGADLLVFPEYGGMELATLAGMNVAADLEQSVDAITERLPEAAAMHRHLAEAFGVHILGGSAPDRANLPAGVNRPVNRAQFFAPSGQTAYQDKQIMTRYEAEEWDIAPGDPLRMFETALGKIGVLICYDSEFPLLGRALSDADIILVPSVTETQHGFSRVRIGSQARALENQCVTAMASIVGGAEWTPALGPTYGAGGVFGPPDRGFPEDGVLAQAEHNLAGWTYADVDMDAIAQVRADGGVLNRRDWACQTGRSAGATITSLH